MANEPSESWTLDEGLAGIYWPNNISAESLAGLEYRVEGVLRTLRRQVSRRTTLAEKITAVRAAGASDLDNIPDVEAFVADVRGVTS